MYSNKENTCTCRRRLNLSLSNYRQFFVSFIELAPRKYNKRDFFKLFFMIFFPTENRVRVKNVISLNEPHFSSNFQFALPNLQNTFQVGSNVV